MALFYLGVSDIAAQILPADQYFQQARKVAFNDKDYPAAIQLCQQALLQHPDDLDFQIFLGRLYYWNNQIDSSLLVLETALQKKPDYEDAAQALADIAYFEKNYAGALAYSAQGLVHHPTSLNLTIRKAKSLAALSRNQEAYALADSLLQKEPRNDQLRALASQLKDFNYSNKVGITYDYTYFDKQFADAWHLTSIDYSRQTDVGSFIGRLNYANRYAKSGWQAEAEAYPRLSKTVYTYTSIGYSPNMPLFPKWRAGFSLYAALPKSFEVEGGWRFLYFDSSTWVYTAAVGKYYKNFWFNARTYLSPGNKSISQAYSLTTRYYTKGADEYLSLSLEQGISPDDRMQAVRFNSTYRLQTFRISAGYRFVLASRHLLALTTGFESGVYKPETKGSQFNLSMGYQLRF